MSRWVLGLGCSLIAVGALAGAELQRFESVEPHMGTLVRITVYARDEQTAKDAFRAAFDRLRALDEILSDYLPDSELNRVTKAPAGQPVSVSADLFTVLNASQDLAQATGGAFDVTQGPVIRLWREARKTGHLPDPSALKEARRRSGFRHLHLDATRRTVMLDIADMALDVGANGKGYAASEAIATLGNVGIRSALVAISGDLAFSSAPPGQRGWRVAITSGVPPAANIPAVLELTDGAVSTSGNAEQHLDVDGRRYSHVIDPSTGMGLLNDITATVIARNGLDADGLDTAVSVLGAERGLALIEARPPAAALIIERDASGAQRNGSSTTIAMSSRFRKIAALAEGAVGLPR